MNWKLSLRVALATAFVVGGVSQADYYTHPDLRPLARCGDIPPGIGCDVDNNPTLPDGSPNPGFGQCIPGTEDPGGVNSLHCQRLFWDLPATTVLGTIEVAAPYAEDPVPRFPNGVTDRIPPLWVGTLSSDIAELGKQAGEEEGFETEEDCLANASGCHRLCPDPLDVPYWKELLNPDGSPTIGEDPTRGGVDEITGLPNGGPQRGGLFELACQRGSRGYYGPWQTAGTVDPTGCKNSTGSDTDALAGDCQGPVFDRIASTVPLKFENTARLDADAADAGVDPNEQERLEWNTGSEIYNHFSSHHGTCSQPTDPCADPKNPPSRADMNDSDGACADYQRKIGPTSSCYAGDGDPRGCQEGDRISHGGFRNATQLPGRLSVPLPGGRGVPGTEDAVWGCNHHVVTQLPPGSYSMTRLANYRLQTHGVTNDTPDVIWGTNPGEEFGGAVGEMVMQYFAKPAGEPVKPLNIMFNAAADAATTYYPPFTWMYHQSQWEPPFDTEVALMALHSHHRMVKGTMNVLPANPLRPSATDPYCGGPQADGTPATDLYTSWFWEDAPVCQYWKEADGSVPLRKGQSLSTVCYVNNGVTPEAIKHGLVAGATVQTLKAMGAPIPDYPAVGSSSTWGAALAESEVGKEFLYGTHPPINYRVVYKCSTIAPTVPYSTLLGAPFVGGYEICPPNPAKDADGDYIDGAYVNEAVCGEGGLCQPGSIVFACVGEDEMCIGVSMYWRMTNLLNADGSINEEGMQKLEDGDVMRVGTPGNVGTETDVSGICTECEGGPGW